MSGSMDARKDTAAHLIRESCRCEPRSEYRGACNDQYLRIRGLSAQFILYTKASLWLKHNGYLNNKIYHSNPILPFILETDPFDTSKFGSIRSLDKRLPAKEIPLHAIIVWDAHFSPNEGQLPLKNLGNSDSLKLLKSFVPKKPMTVLNQYNYEIHIFIKQNDE